MTNRSARVMKNFNLKTDLAKTIIAMSREQDQTSAIRQVRSALFECRYSYLLSCPVDQLEILLSSERTAQQTELAEIQDILENKDNEEIAKVARELRRGDYFLSRVLTALTPDEEWTPEFLRAIMGQLLINLREDYKVLDEIAVLPDAGAQCKSYAEYFSDTLTNEIGTYLEVTPLLGKDVVPTQEIEEMITKCLDRLYDSELETLARLLGVG